MHQRDRRQLHRLHLHLTVATCVLALAWPLVVTIALVPIAADMAAMTASSQPLPPTMLLELWPTTTADRRMAPN